MKVFCYPKCSTCKKALQFLEDHHITYESIDVSKKPPTKTLWKKIFSMGKRPLRSYFNTSGLLYREKNLKETVKDMTQEEAREYLSTYGMLVKRPLVVGDDFILVGFKEEEWKEVLL